MPSGWVLRCGILFALALVGTVTTVYAACPPTFPPSGDTVMPDDDVMAFLMYSETDRTETLVIQPAFSGTATEFGMVMPIPSRPAINEAPDDMFDKLAGYTGGEPILRIQGASESASKDSVIVVEEKDVGDFKATVLTADNAEELVAWLNDNGFEFQDEDLDNFEYYVERGGYYFVAMKVNMDEASIGSDGMVNGKLRPVEFVFESEYPMLPLRIMAHDMDPMSFTLYTLGVFPYYIPGVDVLFMDVINEPTVPVPWWRPSSFEIGSEDTRFISLDPVQDVQYIKPKVRSNEEKLGTAFWERYDPLDKWLVRMNVGFDPRGIEENVILERIGTMGGMIPETGYPIQIDDQDVRLLEPVIINEKMLPPGSGVFAEISINWQDFQSVREIMTPRLQSEYGIPPQSIDCKAGMQLMLRPDGQNTACVMESSVQKLSERSWHASTVRADELSRLR